MGTFQKTELSNLLLNLKDLVWKNFVLPFISAPFYWLWFEYNCADFLHFDFCVFFGGCWCSLSSAQCEFDTRYVLLSTSHCACCLPDPSTSKSKLDVSEDKTKESLEDKDQLLSNDPKMLKQLPRSACEEMPTTEVSISSWTYFAEYSSISKWSHYSEIIITRGNKMCWFPLFIIAVSTHWLTG